MDRECLQIRKNGKLVQTKWVYDEEKEQGSYQEFDITDQAISKLFEVCELAPDITLKDIFLLLNTELDIFDTIIGNWTKEIVTEGLTQPEKPYVKDDEAIEYLELKLSLEYDMNYDNGKNILNGPTRLDFGGVGFEREKDKFFDWVDADGSPVIEFPKGYRTPWSVWATPANELINIPVKIDNKLTITEEIWTDDGIKQGVTHTFSNPLITLGNILYSILWELSFNGPPVKRDAFVKELKETVDNIKKEDYIDMEQLDFEGIDEL